MSPFKPNGLLKHISNLKKKNKVLDQTVTYKVTITQKAERNQHK